jgi:choline dehydrogenase-like flavoprotein
MTAETREAGVIVIGTGPCAAAAASALAGRGADVTVLESGTRRPRGLVVHAMGNTIARWMPAGTMTNEGGFVADDDPRTTWYRALAQGGMSNHWTSAVPRFDPADLDEGTRLDECYRWPVSYDELVPHYEAAERLLDVTGPGVDLRHLPANIVRHRAALPPSWEIVAERAGWMGHGFSVMPLARGPRWMVALRGTEFNSYTEVIDPLAAAGRIDVRLGAHATRLVWSPPAGRVTAVEYVDRATRTTQQLRAAAVMVACGTVNTTRLLMRSTSDDFPHGLGNVHDVLGRYLHDHPKEWWPFAVEPGIELPILPLYMTRADHAASAPLLSASWTIGLASGRDRLRTLVKGRGHRLGVQIFGTTVPEPSRRIRLADGPGDELGEPPVAIDMRFTADELANVHAARERMRDVMAAAGFLATPLADPGDDQLFPGLSVHYGGTVRMHADPRLGMLDGTNCMHAVPNVYVVDMAAFTTGPEKNPTLTAMALASRAAHRVADAL